MVKDAIISNDGLYRYRLDRNWDSNKPKVLFLMLNPSTADSYQDDPTIRRCINFAKNWGFGGLIVGNLFAYRSPTPKILLKAKDPIGNDNLSYLQSMYEESEIIICGWGNSIIVNHLLKNNLNYKPLTGTKDKLRYLSLSKDGTPKHPLYLKNELKPLKYELIKYI